MFSSEWLTLGVAHSFQVHGEIGEERRYDGAAHIKECYQDREQF